MNVIPSTWDTPPAQPALSFAEVHLWRVWLGRPGYDTGELTALLSPDERARAERLHFERDKNYFIAGRAILRLILGKYLQTNPADLAFAYGRQGKPGLVGAETGLRFNLSHSHGLALYAVTCSREVGIDLEHIRPMPDGLQIAHRFFSAKEYAALTALPAEQQTEAFFACWTRKEAYLKACGEGITRELDGFEVSLRPGEDAGLLSVTADPAEPARWAMMALSPAPGFMAALVVQGHGWQLSSWRWSG